jgi:hypothetical protein
MQILLDDIPCHVQAQTVGEAIEGGAEVARDRGRLIVDVTVDGSHLSEADLTSAQQQTRTAGIVRLVSADPVELVRQTLSDAREALAEADGLQREAAELLQSDERTVAMDKLAEAISIWLCVQEAVTKGTQLIGIDLDAERPDGDQDIPDAIFRLKERLNALRRALQDRDEIGLADTLLYEFPQVIEQWQKLLGDLQRRLT